MLQFEFGPEAGDGGSHLIGIDGLGQRLIKIIPAEHRATFLHTVEIGTEQYNNMNNPEDFDFRIFGATNEKTRLSMRMIGVMPGENEEKGCADYSIHIISQMRTENISIWGNSITISGLPLAIHETFEDGPIDKLIECKILSGLNIEKKREMGKSSSDAKTYVSKELSKYRDFDEVTSKWLSSFNEA